MENPGVVERARVSDGCAASSVDGLVQLTNHFKEDHQLGDVILEDFDSYWQDISDRLTVSRMVSDSVIRGMVNAVEAEAANKISQKEQEVAELKETLHLYHVGAEDTHFLGSSDARDEQLYGSPPSKERDKIGDSLGKLRNVASGQLKKLRRDIEMVRGCCSVKRIGSGSQLAGLGGILPENISGRWSDVDNSLDCVAVTVDSIFRRVDEMISLSWTSFHEWKEEQEFQEEIEDMVIVSCVKCVQEEFEEILRDQSARLCDNKTANLDEKIKEISSLKHQLDGLAVSLANIEAGQLTSQGSVDIGEEWNSNKGTDHFHRKSLSNHVSSPKSLWEGNGKHEDMESILPEVDPTRLKHMTKEELIQFHNNEMTMMKRNHESEVQDMTEELYKLKREVLRLKERGSSVPLKREKELDMLRRKIPQVITKLDCILVESDKFPAFNGAESLGSMKERLESFILENQRLRDLLTDKKKEVTCLSSQVSAAEERISNNSTAEANFLKMIGSLKSELEDAHIEAAICNEVYKCFLSGVMQQLNLIIEESNMKDNIMQDIYETLFCEAVHSVEPISKYELEDSDAESIVMHDLYGVLYRETLKDAAEKFSNLNSYCINENKLRVSLELEAKEKEEKLKYEVAEKEKLKQEVLQLVAYGEEKENLSVELGSSLEKEREQLELASQELNKLRDQTSQQKILISEGSKELNDTRSDLVETLKQLARYEEDISLLNQKLVSTNEEARKIDDERRMLVVELQNMKNSKLKDEANEREHRRQLESVSLLAQELLQSVGDIDCKAANELKKISIRLENISSQATALIQMANILKRTGLIYKQKLERRCSDLQKAEAEVDLLGDEVDTLLSLLEKIYIALDHYSPILKHYPGIMEILELVRREISAGSNNKPA